MAFVEESRIDPMQWLAMAPGEPNLVEFADDKQLAELSRLVVDEYDIDKESSSDWRDMMEAGIKLASGKRDEKTYPWRGASNIRYPLVATAALQFNAKAYPAICPPGDVVKIKVNGEDPEGVKAGIGSRVAAHMSHSLRYETPEWERDTDMLTMQLAICGLMFRKTFYDEGRRRRRSILCRPGSVVVNDRATSLEDVPRISEELPLYPTEIIARQRAGTYKDGDWWKENETDSLEPVMFIEQHRPYDLDGDGYPEPYVVIVHKQSQEVVRIAANWKPETVVVSDRGEVLDVPRRDYYQDYHFVPNPAGGFHSIGFGVLLNDISESVNSTLNMMFDAEHFAALPGGFLGKEARLKGGRHRIEPGRWEQIGASGQDVRAAMVQLAAPGASQTMFSLLGLLIEAGREIANVKDIADIAGRADQPATTTLALIDQGQQVFNASYMRLHLGLRGEYRQIAAISAETVDPQAYMAFHDMPEVDSRIEYGSAVDDIEPIADPRAVTKQQKLGQAQLIDQLAMQGRIDVGVATRRVLEAAGIDDTAELMPQPDPAQQEVQAKVAKMEEDMAEASIRRAMLENIKIAREIDAIEADILKAEADATKTMAEAEAADPMNPLNVARVQIEALKARINADRPNGGMARKPDDGARDQGPASGGGGTQGVSALGVLGNGPSGPSAMGGGAGLL